MNLVLYLDDTQFPFLPAPELSSDEYRAFECYRMSVIKAAGWTRLKWGEIPQARTVAQQF
jgi:hypothetical protein